MILKQKTSEKYFVRHMEISTVSIYVLCTYNLRNIFITVNLKVKVEVDSMMKVLSNTQPNFIICLQPHNMSGLCELFRRNPAPALDQKLLRDQVWNVRFWWVKILTNLLTAAARSADTGISPSGPGNRESEERPGQQGGGPG